MTTGELPRASPAGVARIDPVWRDRLGIALAYALSWGLLLVNRGIYWDDWSLVGLPKESVIRVFSELGMPWIGAQFVAVLAMPLSGLVTHVLVFIAYLLSALLFHAILRRTPGLRPLDALVAALTVVVLPVNYARIALIDLTYGLSLLAFLAATWILVRYVKDGGLARRVAALALFFCSFTTASLLVFYAVPILLGAYLVRRAGKVPLRTFAVRHLDFLALPILYWVLKGAFLIPSGTYAGYNAITPRSLTQVPRLLLSVPGDVLGEPLLRAINVAGLLGAAVGIATAWWLLRRSREDETGDVIPATVLAMVGVIVVFLGTVPYLAVGKVPEIWDWSSRHQLLVPFGVGLLAAAAVRPVRGHGPAGAALGLGVGLLLGISAVANAQTLFAYQQDWFKQTALVAAARQIPEVRTARHITVDNTTTDVGDLRRVYRFYEYNAMFARALGNETRLVSNGVAEPAPGNLQTFIDRPWYHMTGYVPSPVDLKLRVSPGPADGSPLEVARLLWLEAIGSPDFETDAARLLDVSVTPAP